VSHHHHRVTAFRCRPLPFAEAVALSFLSGNIRVIADGRPHHEVSRWRRHVGRFDAAPSRVIEALFIEELRKLATAIDRLIELDKQESARQNERLAYLSMMDAVIEALPDALIVTDAAGIIFLFNEKAEFMFGFHRSELIGQPVEQLLPERCRAHHAHVRDMYIRFGVTKRVQTMGSGMDVVGLRSDGSEFQARITLARMIVPQGEFSLALVRFSPGSDEVASVAFNSPEPAQVPQPENGKSDAKL
jgi:PAS domain S-box-containing protein